MARGRFNRLLDCIHRLASGRADSALSDRHLLERFAQNSDEDAFAALVRRHGSLVLSVCRRVLGHEQDAEDAFQAVFLVLARKAGSVRWRDDIGNWLYGVACRVARKARAQAVRHTTRCDPLRDVAAPAAEEREWEELRPVLDEEIGRLPEKYRAPVVLCYLKGKTYSEAAKSLGWAEGTVSGRLARARELLRGRLLRRGLAPSAALLTALPAGSAEAALPATLTAAVVRTASAFALARGISEGVISGPAVALAHEVLRSMLLTKWKIGAVVLLALAATGTTAVLFAQRQPPQKQVNPAPVPAKAPAVPKAEADARPPLKKEWQGRWVANPFAGTTSIEIVHSRSQGGAPRTYLIKEPQTVAALMKQLTIGAFQNDIARGNIPSAILTFHKKDKTSYKVCIASDGTFQCMGGGEIHVHPAFLTALNQQLAGSDSQPIDLTKFLPSPPVKKPAPTPPPTLDTLKTGFQSLRVQSYGRGRAPWEGHITDRKALEELSKSLTVIECKEKELAKGMPYRAQCTAVPKGEANPSSLLVYIMDRQHLFIPDLGLLTIKPSFIKTLNEHLSHLHACTVDILGENQPTEEQTKRERAFRELLNGASALRCIEKGKKEVVVDRREEVEEALKALKWVETPARKYKADAEDAVIEVTTAKGDKVRLAFLRRGEDMDVFPLVANLVEVSGFGQMWLDGHWKDSFRFLAERREMESRERRQMETLRLVSRDLAAFLKQVVNLVVGYREGESELVAWLDAERSRPVLEAMEVEKVEELSWTRQRWQAEMEKLQQRGASTMELTPGIGFSLPVVLAGDKELLIPMYGRVYLKMGIADKLRQALQDNPDKAHSIQLLP
jgi:RNA polymerase sigma factor (sigma-70 family)